MDRLEHARWVLERNLHWIAAAESKTAVILSIDLAMLGALAVAFSALDAHQHTAWATVISTIAAVPLAISIILGARAVWPEIDGPERSFIFFGKVKDWKADRYPSAFHNATDGELLDDCLSQVFRNAEIASVKHARVTMSLKLAFMALPAWMLAVVLLVSAKQ